MVVDGTRVVGNSAIQLAQLASPSSDKLLVRAFMAGYGINDYALFPGIALAMWSCAKPQNRKKVAGLLIPTVISTVFFGVTEPILFTFLFAAPGSTLAFTLRFPDWVKFSRRQWAFRCTREISRT